MGIFGYLRGNDIGQEWKRIFELRYNCRSETQENDSRIFRETIGGMARDYLCRLLQSSSCVAGAYYFSESNYWNGIISLGIGATATIAGRRFDRRRKELLAKIEQETSGRR